MEALSELSEILVGSYEPNDDYRELLGHSLLYFSCGKDPTPILLFGAAYPLYVYADIVDYGQGDFDEEMDELCRRIEKAGFARIRTIDLKINRAKNARMIRWADSKGAEFVLLYVQGDAEDVYRNVYGDGNFLLQPRCVCSICYELFSVTGKNHDILFEARERAEYVLTEEPSQGPNYKCISVHAYYGDYGERPIYLHQRR